MTAFVSHPSVRIKGTENNYEPVSCVSPLCSKSWPHMHCPFCVKTDIFQDPVILKAHYRVKHVDKGIDFSGLKILRCCEHCDIVGTIKGSKEFKGAHWHCYKCKNGFTRRDEAIKHYKTHFRNPSTTFQIQVAQELPHVFPTRDVISQDNSIQQEMTFVETVVTTGAMEASSEEDVKLLTEVVTPAEESGKPNTGEIQVSVAANETVDTCDGQTLMIISGSQSFDTSEVTQTTEQPKGERTAFTELQAIMQKHTKKPQSIVQTPAKAISLVESPMTTQAIQWSPPATQGVHWRQEKLQLERQVRELQAQVTQLSDEKTQLEQRLQQETDALKNEMHGLTEEVASYQRREAVLLSQLKVPVENRLSFLLQDLHQQHSDLLTQQLAQLRHAYIQQQLSEDDVAKVSGSASRSEESVTGAEVTRLVCETGPEAVLDSDVYRSLPQATICGGNVVLNSQALMTDSMTEPQLFVVPATLEVKREDDVDGSQQLETGFEEVAQSEGSLDYTEVEEQDSEEVSNLGEKIILLQSAEDISSIEYAEKVDETISMDSISVDQIEVSAEDHLSVQESHKRKLDFHDSDGVKRSKPL